ncbi:hypothetical protein [Saccharopolyspora hordei]|uniref:Uncharacterized protein n=1 Tax=Saccharopolyspora hordei TaxID=1838 RepID=A0A853AG32_9PSEU|nr:hypothetical protein [Saccharopolyspora hordei]NYI83534.1 hypothetical protein [Saccharopolyspora hordei]
MINSLAGFAWAATIGIGAILGSPMLMSWFEHRMLGSRTAARGERRRQAGASLRDLRWRQVISVPRRTPVGGPGAMRRPGLRRSFDRPTPARRPAKPRS